MLAGQLNGMQAIERDPGEVAGGDPAIVLTGDISVATLRDIAASGCVVLSKPARDMELLTAMDGLLAGHGLKHPRALASRLNFPSSGPSCSIGLRLAPCRFSASAPFRKFPEIIFRKFPLPRLLRERREGLMQMWCGRLRPAPYRHYSSMFS